MKEVWRNWVCKTESWDLKSSTEKCQQKCQSYWKWNKIIGKLDFEALRRNWLIWLIKKRWNLAQIENRLSQKNYLGNGISSIVRKVLIHSFSAESIKDVPTSKWIWKIKPTWNSLESFPTKRKKVLPCFRADCGKEIIPFSCKR